jgi:hypothetical protein
MGRIPLHCASGCVLSKYAAPACNWRKRSETGGGNLVEATGETAGMGDLAGCLCTHRMCTPQQTHLAAARRRSPLLLQAAGGEAYVGAVRPGSMCVHRLLEYLLPVGVGCKSDKCVRLHHTLWIL